MSDPHERLETACALAADEPIPAHKLFCDYCDTKQYTTLSVHNDQTVACGVFCVTRAIIAIRRCNKCGKIIDILISPRPALKSDQREDETPKRRPTTADLDRLIEFLRRA